MNISAIVKPIFIIKVVDFFDVFEDTLPEGVGLDEYLEVIQDSDISFGNNTDTLLAVYEAYTFFIDAVPPSHIGVVTRRYEEFIVQLMEQYNNNDVFVSLGC